MTDASRIERVRRWRARTKAGALFCMADAPGELVETLIDRGYLAEDDSFDARLIGQALVKATIDMLKNTRNGVNTETRHKG